MRTYLVVSGLVFGAVALVHLLRLVYGWPAQVGGLVLPLWVSAIALIVPGVLCVWAFALARGVRGA
ncbi:MAG TPA: hypothetical protein VFJ70_08780 [Burkholderiales bacterium]|nr:hypothetical protein [Burkholderiales bacterium]